MNLTDTAFRTEVQVQFEELLKVKFPILQPTSKWKQIMWHKEEKLIVSLVFSTNKLKFCFFNNPNLKLDKLQRWGTTIYSQNLEISDASEIVWKEIEALINDTVDNYS